MTRKRRILNEGNEANEGGEGVRNTNGHELEAYFDRRQQRERRKPAFARKVPRQTAREEEEELEPLIHANGR